MGLLKLNRTFSFTHFKAFGSLITAIVLLSSLIWLSIDWVALFRHHCRARRASSIHSNSWWVLRVTELLFHNFRLEYLRVERQRHIAVSTIDENTIQESSNSRIRLQPRSNSIQIRKNTAHGKQRRNMTKKEL